MISMITNKNSEKIINKLYEKGKQRKQQVARTSKKKQWQQRQDDYRRKATASKIN